MPGVLHNLDPRLKEAPPRDPKGLQEAARKALKHGDAALAVEYLSTAVELAPLNRALRAELVEAMVEHARARTSRTSGQSRTRVLAELEEAPPSRPAPKAPRPPRETKAAEPAKPAAAPKRRAAERPAPAPEDPSDRYVRADLGAGEPRTRAGKPRADRSGPLAALKGRGNARYIVSAVFCTGVLLVVAGLAQAWISRAVSSADLPQVNAAAQLPDGLTALLGDATARLVAGEPDQAMKVLEDAAVAWPEYQSAIATARVRTLRAKGTRHLAAREYPKAIEAYRAAAELEPKAADNWIELGRAYREHGRSRQASNASEGRTLLNKAVASYRRALEIQADNGTAMVGLAQAFTFLNDRKGAVAMYEKVLAQAPNSPEASIARQNLAQLTGRV